MEFLQLEEIKKHLNIDEDFTDDDLYIESLGTVAENVVERHIDVKLNTLDTEAGDLPPALRQAMLLLIGHLYANREAVGPVNDKELPLGYKYLLDLYTDWTYKF